MRTQIDSFRDRIKDASQADSHAGERISHKEAKQALAELKGAPDTEANLAVEDVLESALLTAGGRKALLKFLNDNGAGGAVSAATLARLRAAFARQSDVQWRAPGALLPVGVRFERAVLKDDADAGIADGFKHTALIPVGAVRPEGSKADPNKATQFYVERTGGLMGTTQVAGPFSLAPRSARELRELLNSDAHKRSDVITAAYPKGYPKMTPAVIGAIRDLDGKTYQVTVDLVRFYDKKVVSSQSVLVDVDPFKVWSNARIGPFGPESPAIPDPTFDTPPAVIG